MGLSSKISGVALIVIAMLLLRQSSQHGFQESMHAVLTRDPPIVGHPRYGRLEEP